MLVLIAAYGLALLVFGTSFSNQDGLTIVLKKKTLHIFKIRCALQMCLMFCLLWVTKVKRILFN